MLQPSATANDIPVICAAAPHSAGEDISYLADALERQLNLPDSPQSSDQPLWSLTSIDLHPPGNTSPEQVLVLVEAHLDALQLAYARIKPLQHYRDTRFNVVVHGARDTETGRRYYRRLAMGTLRFLDLPLLYCGIAPQRGHSFSQEIANLAQRLKQATVPFIPLPGEEVS